LLVVPFGIYLQTRFKNLATNKDFTLALKQLKKTTDAVEKIKNEKYWVKQQVWDTKRQAYEEILSCLYLTKTYIDRQVNYLSEYTDCFVHIGSSSYDFEDEEYEKSYVEYVESEQKSFNEKYESKSAINERQELSQNTRKSFNNLESVFSIKSIYLDPKLKEIEGLLSMLRRKLYEDQPSQDDQEGNDGFLDRLIGHHVKSEELVNDIIMLTKDLAVKDLKLSI
jgi:phospholipid N-methyltransferase